MRLTSTATRVVGSGLAALLTAGGITALVTQPANAAAVTSTYTCAIPGLFSDTFTLGVKVALLPTSAPAGFPVPAGLLTSTETLTVPTAEATLLSSMSVNGGHANDFTVAMGPTTFTDPLTFTQPTLQGDGSAVFNGTGKNSAFATGPAGTYSVSLPGTFHLVPTSGGKDLPAAITCTTSTPASLGTITTTKQASTTTAKAPKKIKKTKTKVKVTITNSFTAGPRPTGTVTAKDGKKTLAHATVTNGTATLVLPKLKAGHHKIVVSYSGNGYATGSSTTLTLTVKK